MDPGSHVGFQINFWQVWLISVQRFQRRRFKCEKLTDGRLPMTKAIMDKGAGGNRPPHFEKLRVAKLIYPPTPFFSLN
jgi:hypothetical protein